MDHATQFYKEPFGPSTPFGLHMEPGCWDPFEMVNTQDNEELEKPFSKLEVKESIFSMEKNTAPRPDHFPVEFCQHCWEIVKRDLVALFDDFYHMRLPKGA